MTTLEIRRRENEPAQVAFDRVYVFVKRLIAARYAAKLPTQKTLREGQFALDKLPNAEGWRITISPFPGEQSPVSA